MIPNPLTPYGVPLDVLNGYLKSLYDADWEDPRGTIRFSDGVRLEELADAVIFHNTRTYLSALQAEGGTAATATGCLNRVFVGRNVQRAAPGNRISRDAPAPLQDDE